MHVIADGAEPHVPGVDAGTDRDPWSVGIGVAGGAQEVEASVHGALRMVRAEDRVEHRNDLVADELVDESVVGEHRGRCNRSESVEQVVELARCHALRHRRRTTDVGKEHRPGDLCPAMVLEHHLSHWLHVRGFAVDCALPIARIKRPPNPWNGEPHS